MTKETKIGLLVGLAFIVLFAIILSEKGATPGTKPPSDLTMADANEEGDAPPAAQRPLHDAGRLPVDPNLAPIVSAPPVTIEAPPMGEEPVGQLVPQDDSEIVPLPLQLVERLNLPVDDDPTPDADEIQDEPLTGEGPVTLLDAVAAARDAQEEPAITPERAQPRVEETLVTHTATPDPTPVEPPKPVAPTPKPAPKAIVVQAIHEVQPGETLGRIAAKYYGRCTLARLQAIQQANPGVLASVDDIRPNMKLTIPVLVESGELFEPANNVPVDVLVAASSRAAREDEVRIPLPIGARAAKPPRDARTNEDRTATPRDTRPSSESANFRWYEVRKSDSLAKIAKRELGDERRFMELYRLNRDRIPDKDKIRPGVKIRIPAATSEVASSQGQRTPDM